MTMLADSRKLFLIDGLGALLSAFLLGIVLIRFEAAFGMPRNILYFLSLIACALATYSLTCYFLAKKIRKPHIKIIGWANLSYCCLTIGLLFSFYEKITALGLFYFLGEVAIIITLAAIELRTAYKQSPTLF